MGLICPTATNVEYVSLTIPERVGLMLECSELALWPDADQEEIVPRHMIDILHYDA